MYLRLNKMKDSIIEDRRWDKIIDISLIFVRNSNKENKEVDMIWKISLI